MQMKFYIHPREYETWEAWAINVQNDIILPLMNHHDCNLVFLDFDNLYKEPLEDRRDCNFPNKEKIASKSIADEAPQQVLVLKLSKCSCGRGGGANES